MYLRTTKRRNADGSEIRYYQLAENAWDAARGCAVAKVVYNFGRADQVDGDKLRRLAKSILRVFGGEEPATTDMPGDVRIRDTRTYGGVYALEALWKELGMRIPARPGQPFQPDPGSRSDGTRAAVPVTRAAVPTAPGQPFRWHRAAAVVTPTAPPGRRRPTRPG
jgi:hypothetical protein